MFEGWIEAIAQRTVASCIGVASITPSHRRTATPNEEVSNYKWT